MCAWVLWHLALLGTFKIGDIYIWKGFGKWFIYQKKLHEQWNTDPSFFWSLKQYFMYIFNNILFFWRLYKNLFSKKILILINIRQMAMYNVIKHFFSLDMAPETNVASLSELRFIVTVRRLAAITYSEREMLCSFLSAWCRPFFVRSLLS